MMVSVKKMKPNTNNKKAAFVLTPRRDFGDPKETTMKPVITASTIVYFVVVSVAALLIDCGGTGDGSANDNAANIGATTSALTNSVSDRLLATTGTSHLIRYAASDEFESETAASFSCEYDETTDTEICACPGGGTISRNYDNEVNILVDAGEPSVQSTFEHSFVATFDACVVESCGQSKTINGSFTGSLSGSTNNGNVSVTMTQETEATCSGITIDQTAIGFSVTATYDGLEPVVSGTICLDPPGEVITFDSLDELLQIMDPNSSCEITTQAEGSATFDGDEAEIEVTIQN